MEQNLNLTRIMITHDMSVVATSCNKIAVMYAGEIIEMGLVNDVLRSPKHPYTQGLIESFPSLKGQRNKLQAIAGRCRTFPRFMEIVYLLHVALRRISVVLMKSQALLIQPPSRG